ncbi:MAG: hypothetical protein RLZZ499_2214 [Cyanobacteriota bacterium]|jgi:hypothetical protein
MNNYLQDRDHLNTLIASGSEAEVDRFMQALHIQYHISPLQHINVHVDWMRVYLLRKSYHKVLWHTIAGLIFAVPASLLEKYAGLVVPVFKNKQ